MRQVLAVVAWVSVGCVDADLAPLAGGSAPITGGCTVDADNALRATCRASTTAEQPVSMRVFDSEGALIFERLTPAGTEHEVHVFGLAAGEHHVVEIAAGTDVLVRDLDAGMPQMLRDIETSVAWASDAPSAVDHVLVTVSCGSELGAAMLGVDGQIRWYQDVSPVAFELSALSWTESGTVLMLLDRERVLEITLAGDIVRSWDQDVLGQIVHHDVSVDDGVLHALTAEVREDPETVDAWIVDGVAGWDEDGTLVESWSLADLVEITGRDDAKASKYWQRWLEGADAYHANGLFVDREGDAYVSLYLPGSVVRVHPNGLEQAELVWTLSGDEDSDIALPAGLDLAGGQHHVRRRPQDGTLALFDNGAPDKPSRALALDIDDEQGVAKLVHEMSLERHCTTAGSVFALSGGHALLTCGDARQVIETDLDGQEVWRAELECAVRGAGPIPRGVPVALADYMR
jgi:hypothetical protein